MLNDFEIRTKNIKNLKNANIEENLDLVGANLQRPSVQGITFKVSKRDTSSFIKIFSKNCGRYEKIKIKQKKKLDKDKESKSNSEKEIVEKNFWIRKPCYFEEEFLISKILEKRILKKEIKDTGKIKLEIFLQAREIRDNLYITACLINRTLGTNSEKHLPKGEECLFQTKFSVSMNNKGNKAFFLPIQKKYLIKKPKMKKTNQ